MRISPLGNGRKNIWRKFKNIHNTRILPGHIKLIGSLDPSLSLAKLLWGMKPCCVAKNPRNLEDKTSMSFGTEVSKPVATASISLVRTEPFRLMLWLCQWCPELSGSASIESKISSLTSSGLTEGPSEGVIIARPSTQSLVEWTDTFPNFTLHDLLKLQCLSMSSSHVFKLLMHFKGQKQQLEQHLRSTLLDFLWCVAFKLCVVVINYTQAFAFHAVITMRPEGQQLQRLAEASLPPPFFGADLLLVGPKRLGAGSAVDC